MSSSDQEIYSYQLQGERRGQGKTTIKHSWVHKSFLLSRKGQETSAYFQQQKNWRSPLFSRSQDILDVLTSVLFNDVSMWCPFQGGTILLELSVNHKKMEIQHELFWKQQHLYHLPLLVQKNYYLVTTASLMQNIASGTRDPGY